MTRLFNLTRRERATLGDSHAPARPPAARTALLYSIQFCIRRVLYARSVHYSNLYKRSHSSAAADQHVQYAGAPVVRSEAPRGARANDTSALAVQCAAPQEHRTDRVEWSRVESSRSRTKNNQSCESSSCCSRRELNLMGRARTQLARPEPVRTCPPPPPPPPAACERNPPPPSRTARRRTRRSDRRNHRYFWNLADSTRSHHLSPLTHTHTHTHIRACDHW